MYRQRKSGRIQGIVKDILFILHPEIDSIESCIQAVSETIEFYMNEYPQERLMEKHQP